MEEIVRRDRYVLAHESIHPADAEIALAKPGTYGYTPAPTFPQDPVQFAFNVTPVYYTAPSPTPSQYGCPLPTSLPLPLFPPCATSAPAPTRRRVPPGGRRSQGYVPRPPNAFMLFRADFVRRKHVSGSIETYHDSLGKIIGQLSSNIYFCRHLIVLDRKLLDCPPSPREAHLENKSQEGKSETQAQVPRI